MNGWFASLFQEFRQVSIDLLRSPAWRKIMFFLLPYMGVLVGLDAAAHYGAITHADLPVQFFFSQDGSFGEFLEYSFTSAIAVMLFLLWRRTGASVYLANAVLFVWLTADNAIEFHEKFGHWIAPAIPMPAGSPVHANDIGEAMLFAFIGGIWLISLLSSLRSASPRPAIHALMLASCVGAAAFFGVFVDMMVVWGHHTPALKEFETWLEDGGEFAMLSLCFFLMVAIFDVERRRAVEPKEQRASTPLAAHQSISA